MYVITTTAAAILDQFFPIFANTFFGKTNSKMGL